LKLFNKLLDDNVPYNVDHQPVSVHWQNTLSFSKLIHNGTR